MHILLVNNTKIPALKYGGTERVIWALGKALVALGHQVSYLVAEGSSCPFAMVYTYHHSKPLQEQIPANIDLVHVHFPIAEPLSTPYLVTIHGNGKASEQFQPNTVFLSQNHAKRHHAQHFVYNGLDWDEYGKVDWKADRKHLLFLAKTSRKEKNVNGAIEIAKNRKTPIQIIGGWKISFNKFVHFRGQLGGDQKNALLNHGLALLNPIRWHEPFGLAPIEALYFGNPVFATPYGSMPELIIEDVGFLSTSGTQMVEALDQLTYFSRKLCHSYALDRFNHLEMAKNYLGYYERVLGGEQLHDTQPFVAANNVSGLLPYAP